MSDDGNSRVTVAILKSELAHLSDQMDRYHTQICEDLREYKQQNRETVQDHEARLRTLEGRRGPAVWADVGSYFAAIGAFVASLLNN